MMMRMHPPFMGNVQSPITELLLVCPCGRIKTETLDGHWTLEQLQANPAQAEADELFLRKIGICSRAKENSSSA